MGRAWGRSLLELGLAWGRRQLKVQNEGDMPGWEGCLVCVRR